MLALAVTVAMPCQSHRHGRQAHGAWHGARQTRGCAASLPILALSLSPPDTTRWFEASL